MVLPATVEDFFFSLLSPASLLLYSRTCRTAYHGVKSYMRRAFKLSNVLSPYFTPQEILYFRYLQWEHGILISGSTALRFFNRVPFNDDHIAESDLDIYVELRFCENVARWLMHIGYEFKQRTWRTPDTFLEALRKTDSLDIRFYDNTMFYASSERPYIGRGIANVFNFWRNGRKIQIISSDSSPLEIILNFHSTCVMNIISYAKAYCLYPKGTFEEYRSLLHSTQGTNQDNAIEKYEIRGWNMVNGIVAQVEIKDPKSAFAPSKRFVGDGKCWSIALEPTMPFGQPGFGESVMNDYIEANSWELRYAGKYHNYNAEMSFHNISSKCFKFRYMVADTDLADLIQAFFGMTKGYHGDPDWNTREGYKDNALRMLIRWNMVSAVHPND